MDFKPAALEFAAEVSLEPLWPRVEPPVFFARAGFGLFLGGRLGLLALIASL